MTYVYYCKKCKKEFEYDQKITEKPLEKCPTCKSDKLGRVPQAGIGIIFKGPGFYVNDYGKGK